MIEYSQIMNDNILYLNEWIKYNDSFRKLQIVGPDLVCNLNGRNESIDISDYYLPNILYNPLLREKIQTPNGITAEDLFRIIRVNVLAESFPINKSNQNDLYITKLELRKNSEGTDFLYFEDNYGHKFKLTQNIQGVLRIYQQMYQMNAPVNFYEFKRELEGLKNGEK